MPRTPRPRPSQRPPCRLRLSASLLNTSNPLQRLQLLQMWRGCPQTNLRVSPLNVSCLPNGAAGGSFRKTLQTESGVKRSNMAGDADVLSPAIAGLLSAGHFYVTRLHRSNCDSTI
jgi:hypothetical protein